MKRVLFLGAANFQVPPIEYALRAGYYVLTCDNRPQNPGHRLAHESHDVSTVDHGAVFELARSRAIDGVLSFASDVSTLTAAVVARALGLPGASVETVDRLTRKPLFRKFLNDTGLQRQRYKVFHRDNIGAAAAFVRDCGGTAVVKPTDSSGSKGVSVVRSPAEIDAAFAYAFSESRSNELIVEEFIRKSGSQICGDGYMDQSKLVFVEFGDGHFHEKDGLLSPFAETFPSSHSTASLDLVARTIETILAKIGYKRGPFNVDAFIACDGQPFIIEIGPRCGGNFIPIAIRYQTGVDLIAAAVEGCLDSEYVLDLAKSRSQRSFASYMLHSRRGGIFRGKYVDPSFRDHIVNENLYVKPSAKVPPFKTAGDVIGNLILSFASRADMMEKVANLGAYYGPDVE